MMNHLIFCLLAISGLQLCLSLRVDNLKGFRYCKIPQMAKLERVDVLGKACNQWPCIMTPGRVGTFQVTMTQETGYPINHLKSDIFANARLKIGGRRRVGLDGETEKPACPFTRPGCPFQSHQTIVISKTVKVPQQVRLVKSPMIVEFRITDEFDRILTCFMAPVIVG
ncbi:hypothetical protein Anas_00470 [Armadillidium nasatum]|uniref:MD-2-related lipid-recognition domain-containing protein n=1 Tax=Armadillidium nasatum TaxID=96803 RepID=A0A5N5SKP0_9CRUS|nr:hypothetical protein Anas_00470 [Armadillidium nasatum]